MADDRFGGVIRVERKNPYVSKDLRRKFLTLARLNELFGMDIDFLQDDWGTVRAAAAALRVSWARAAAATARIALTSPAVIVTRALGACRLCGRRIGLQNAAGRR
jgi:hypothetical protein